jgi:hypothetical protein
MRAPGLAMSRAPGHTSGIFGARVENSGRGASDLTDRALGNHADPALPEGVSICNAPT